MRLASQSTSGLIFQTVEALVPLDLLGVLPCQALLAADTGDPGVVLGERALERLDLADMAAAVGVALPEVRPSSLCCSAIVITSGRISSRPYRSTSSSRVS